MYSVGTDFGMHLFARARPTSRRSAVQGWASEPNKAWGHGCKVAAVCLAHAYLTHARSTLSSERPPGLSFKVKYLEPLSVPRAG